MCSVAALLSLVRGVGLMLGRRGVVHRFSLDLEFDYVLDPLLRRVHTHFITFLHCQAETERKTSNNS